MRRLNLSDWALKHPSFVVYLMLAALFAGAFSYVNLGRAEDPPFTIKTMVVSVQWPGAGVQEMLDQITDRVERKLEETPQLDYLQSYTKPGESVIFVILRDDTPPEDVQDIWYQVRKKIADIRATLPSDALDPHFDDEFGDTYGIVYAFTSDGFTDRELRDYLDDVRADLLQVDDVSKVSLLGVQEEVVWLDFSPREISSRGIEPDQVVAALRARNAVVPAGVIDTGAERIQVRVTGAFASEDALRSITLNAGGRLYRLSDLSEVRRGTVDPPAPRFRFNGQPALGLAISMAEGGDNLRFGDALRARMDAIVADLPIGIDAHLVADQPEVVRRSIDEFTRVLIEAVVIVLAVSFVSLGTRAGVVVLAAIPLALAMTFAGMFWLDIDLQRISLGALIIALGLLVDDAMITVESMVSRLEQGDDVRAAAVFAFTSTAMPMSIGTFVTIAGFLPVALAAGASSEYCYSMFVVITLALVNSLIVAVLFCPLIGVKVLAGFRPKHKPKPSRLAAGFARALQGAMRHRYAVVAVTVVVLALSLVGAGSLEQQFFPASDRPELLATLTLPQNASIEATQRDVERVEALLKDDPNVVHYSFYVGSGAIRFYLPLDAQLAHDNIAQAVIVTRGLEEREALRQRLEQVFETQFDTILARVSALELGPPVGWPIRLRVAGPDVERVRSLAYTVAEAVGADATVRNINFNWIEPARVVRLVVDQATANQVGVTSADLANALHSIVSGVSITQLRDSTYLVNVIARAAEDERRTIDSLRNLRAVLPGGRSVPVSQFVRFEYATEQPLIWRRDRLATITVQADVAPGIQAATVMERIGPALAALRENLPPGYRIESGGTVEESAKGTSSIVAMLPLTVLVMITLLMIQLQSFQRMLIVLSVAPLGLIGVVGALLLTGTPMGFVAMLGVIALIGMIVRNSVILIAQIEHNIAAGLAPWNAVYEATLHRVRPIMLTAAAAILGMIPIVPQVFWSPMAIAIMGGLAVATALTLLFLPALYVMWFRLSPPPDSDAVATIAAANQPHFGRS